MADKIKVNISMLTRDYNDMANLARAAKNSLDELTAAMLALNATWEGSAHTVLEEQYEADRSMMEAELESLSKFLEWVRMARDEYRKCESQVAETISSIRV